MGQLYFAYGSNLNHGQMARRCPNARFVGPLMLPGFKLVFRGCADIEWERGAECPGAVWELTPACVRGLDGYEGVKSGLYFKHYVPVSINRGGERVTEDMLVYIMSDRWRASQPSRYYFQGIEQGYRDCGLTEHLPVLQAALVATGWTAWPVYKPHKWNRKRYKARSNAYYWDSDLKEWVLRPEHRSREERKAARRAGYPIGRAKPAKGAHKARESDDDRAPWEDDAARYEAWLRANADGKPFDWDDDDGYGWEA